MSIQCSICEGPLVATTEGWLVCPQCDTIEYIRPNDDQRQARTLTDLVPLTSIEYLSNGVQVLLVPCPDHRAYQGLPKAMSYHGQSYGLTGWNSDRCVAYYRSDALMAVALPG